MVDEPEPEEDGVHNESCTADDDEENQRGHSSVPVKSSSHHHQNSFSLRGTYRRLHKISPALD